MRNDPEALRSLAKAAIWGAAIFAVIAGIAGALQIAASQRRKLVLQNTPPSLVAQLERMEDGYYARIRLRARTAIASPLLSATPVGAELA